MLTVPMRPWIATAIVVASLLSAVAAGQQAFGNAVARVLPDTAAKASSSSPYPLEKLARANMAVGTQEQGFASVDVSKSLPYAREALDRSLLSPLSLAILAWNAPPEQRERILAAASNISRREALLQTALMIQASARGDDAATLPIIDALLRVNPEATGTIGNGLVQALRQEAAIPELRKLMAGGAPWSDAFLISASRDAEAVDNLVRLRLALPPEADISPETDRELVVNLVRAGNFGGAIALYRAFDPSGKTAAQAQQLDWKAQFPPFDWGLADSYDAYARTRREGGLAIRVQPGSGGVLATRMLDLPSQVTALRIEHAIDIAGDRDTLSAKLTCAGDGPELSAKDFTTSPVVLPVPARPAGCDVLVLSIEGRAWSTGDTIEGPITAIKLLR
ncbi:MAG: hypothetical protein CL807_01725 [Citromicrobium sp.]|nr:hypothetical protein [Citromicrobium sp.]MBD75618.1 hypothetical protein [Citromicrobium sp.]|tara:strand:- start:21378 stop:22556 length:1179 start_codon:yes stop_codon:yes gene_type:complete